MLSQLFLSDEPIVGIGKSLDSLDRENFAAHVVELLDRVRSQAPSSVLALIGPWGSGKSSILNLISENLVLSKSEWISISFNPWDYSDTESILLAFFSALRSELPRTDKWDSVREKVGNFGAAISPLGKLTAALGVDSSPALKLFSEWIKGDRSANTIRSELETALTERNQPILVILDDLDRLTPDELLLTFKLVRNLGRLPNVYYLLSYDERTLHDTLMQTHLVGRNEVRAREYVEKMVQVRIDIPPLRPFQREQLFSLSLESLCAQHKFNLDHSRTQRVAEVYQKHLKHKLQTPRSIRRFFGQIDAFLSLLGTEVDFVDFLLLSFIRTTYPNVYELIVQNRDGLTGQSYVDLGPTQARDDRFDLARREWISRLASSGVEQFDQSFVFDMLATLFISIRSIKERRSGSDSLYAVAARESRLTHYDYFDRYFAFGVPREDIADQTVIDALGQLTSGDGSASVDELRRKMASDAALISRKILKQHITSTIPIQETLVFLTECYELAEEDPAHEFASPRRSIESLADRLMSSLDFETACQLIREATARNYLGLCMYSYALVRYHQEKSDGDQDTSVWSCEIAAELCKQIEDLLSRPENDSLDNLPRDAFNLIWVWQHLNSDDAVSWMRSQVTEGRWSLLDVLFKSVPIFYTIDSSGQRVARLAEWNPARIEPFFSIQYLVDTLALNIITTPPYRDHGTALPVEEVDTYVLGQLRVHLDRLADDSS